MFGHQFHPTPAAVIDRMVEPLLKNHPQRGQFLPGQKFLDPSAGRGDILDAIKPLIEKWGRESPLYSCEIDLDLRMILQSKGYQVIASDFLTYQNPIVRFDTILMNPPFDGGAKHVVHAWDCSLSDNGNLVALLNAETIANPYTKERRRLIGLIEQYGTIENIGPAFAQSENPTDVEVVIVRLKKPNADKICDFDASNFKTRNLEFETGDDFSSNPLARADIIAALVDQYNAALSALIDRDRAERRLDFLLENTSRLGRINDFDLDKPFYSIESRADVIREVFWDTLFERSKLASRTTSQFRREFEVFRSGLKLDFNESNIREVLGMFFQNVNNIMEKALLQVFDEATRFHEKNQIHSEGWKTNKGWKLNKKIIYPYGVGVYKCAGFHICDRTFLTDIDRVLCWLAGQKIEDIQTTRTAVASWCSQSNLGTVTYSDEFESHFFKIRMFKKGTLHLAFKDQTLLNELNRRAAIGKQWIGGDGF